MALRLLLGQMAMCNSLLFPSMVGDDHAAGLLCYANVLRRSSGSPFISRSKADQRHDLAGLASFSASIYRRTASSNEMEK